MEKNHEGKSIYIEPPQAPPGYGYGGGYRGQGGMSHNPCGQGPRANPDARFIRPQNSYYRPYGYGYRGLGLSIAGGLLGGALLGSAFF